MDKKEDENLKEKVKKLSALNNKLRNHNNSLKRKIRDQDEEIASLKRVKESLQSNAHPIISSCLMRSMMMQRQGNELMY